MSLFGKLTGPELADLSLRMRSAAYGLSQAPRDAGVTRDIRDIEADADREARDRARDRSRS
jgi:hypothetical protein